MHSYLESFAGAFDGGGFSSQSLCTFTKCLSCFFSSSLLYSFLQAGRFTTKRQRESPINLVANHALDSSVDLCLCPSVCIFSFLFPPHLFPSSLYLTCLSLLSTIVLFICDIVDLLFHPPHRPHLTHITHFLFLPLAPSLSDLKCSIWFLFFFSDHQRISITCTHWRLCSKLIWTVSVESN